MAKEEQLKYEDSLKTILEMNAKLRASHLETGYSQILWGAVIIVCYVMQYFVSSGVLSLPISVWYLIYTAWLIQIYLTHWQRKKQRFMLLADYHISIIWYVAGLCSIFVQVISNLLINDFIHNEGLTQEITKRNIINSVWTKMNAIFLLFIALPATITGLLMRDRIILLCGLLVWICTSISIFINNNNVYLFSIGAVLAGCLLPGILLNYRFRTKRFPAGSEGSA